MCVCHQTFSNIQVNKFYAEVGVAASIDYTSQQQINRDDNIQHDI